MVSLEQKDQMGQILFGVISLAMKEASVKMSFEKWDQLDIATKGNYINVIDQLIDVMAIVEPQPKPEVVQVIEPIADAEEEEGKNLNEAQRETEQAIKTEEAQTNARMGDSTVVPRSQSALLSSVLANSGVKLAPEVPPRTPFVAPKPKARAKRRVRVSRQKAKVSA